jgi:RNA polymerase sigma-70 factor, ECF subfamily
MYTTPVSLLERLRLPTAQEDWVRFVRLYTPLLYHWACRLGLQEQDSADLVQDVLTLLVQKLPDFHYDQQKSFRAWLRTVMLNRWRNERRKRVVQVLGAAVEELPEAEPMDNLEESEYRHYIVGRALELMQAEFQPITWQAFWRHMVLGESPAEVAQMLNIRIDSVYAAKSRVLRRLRQELNGLLE